MRKTLGIPGGERPARLVVENSGGGGETEEQWEGGPQGGIPGGEAHDNGDS